MKWRQCSWFIAACFFVSATMGWGGVQESLPEAQPTPEAEAVSSPRAVTVAVASFGTGLTFPSLEPLCVGGTPQTLAAKLRRVYLLNVRDATKTYEALTAQKFEAAKVPLDDVAAQRRACEAADAQFLIVGSYKDASGEGVKPETSVKIRVALFARETGRSEDIGTVEGRLKDLPRLHAELTTKTLDKFRALGLPVRPVEWLEATREDTTPLDAYLLYAEGNVLWLQKKTSEAQRKYREAYQKSGGGFDAALAAYERVGRQRIEELEKAGGDAQAEIQKEDAELKSLAEQNKRTGEMTLAAREMWKARRLRHKSPRHDSHGATEELKKSYNTAIALCQTFLARGTAQALKWKAEWRAPSSPFSTDVRPTVVDGVIYAGSADGYVFAFDAQTGARRWRFRAGQACATTPTVADGVVYIGCDDGAVYALDVASGQLKWKFETKAAVWSSPVVSNGVVFFGSNDRNLYAVNAATGQLKWQLPTQGGIVASPRVLSGVVYVGSRDNRLYAVDAASGQVKWRFTTTADILTTVAIESRNGRGAVYFGANDGQAYALDAVTGAIQWKTNLGGFVQGSPVISDGVVYIGASNALHALDATNGAVKWKVPAQTIPAPVVQGDVVYAALGDENVYALDAKSGQLRWRFPTESTLLTSPRPTESALVVASDQHLYALNPQVETFPSLEEDALFQLGIAYHETGEFAKARDALTQLTERRPLYSADAYHLLADCYQRLNQTPEEISARLKAFVLQPAEPSRDGDGTANVWERLHQIAGLRWVYRAGGRAFWQSVVDGNVIYVGANDRQVTALDTTTGQARWKTDINAPAWFAPVVGERLVYVATPQGAIYALDKRSGMIRWRATTTAGPPSGPPVMVGNQLLIGAAGRTLFSLNATTGQRNWSVQIGAPLSSPCAVGDMLFFTSQSGDLHAFDMRALDSRWKLNVGASVRTPVHEQGVLYVASQKVCAVDLASGKVKWQFAPEAATCSAPVVTPTLVCVGASNGYVYALDKATGGVKWKFWLLSGGAPPSVTVADDVLYASTLGGQIYAFDLNSGAFQWKFQAAGRFFSAPTVGGGKLFAACEDRNVYALDLAHIAALRAQGKTWWKELWSDAVGQAMLSADATQARRRLQRAAELAEDNFAAHFEIGWRACDVQAYDVARRQAMTLTQLDAEHPDVPWLLARIEKEEKHFVEAEKHLREVVRRAPRFLKAYLELEAVLEAQVKKFVPANEMPKDAALTAALADTYLQKEQFEKAIAEYKRAIEMDPRQAQPYNNLAWLYATCKDEKLRNPAESLRLARKAVELAPRAASLWDTLAEAYFVNQRYNEAIDAITQAISLDPHNAFYRAQLAKFRKAKQGG